MAADPRLDPKAWGAGNAIRRMRIASPETPLFNRDRNGITSTLRYGDLVDIYLEDGNWSLVSGVHDGYLGWAKDTVFGEASEDTLKTVTTFSTHLYPKANMKTPPLMALSLGASLVAIGEDGDFTKTRAGYIFSEHLEPRELDAADWAAKLLGAPYLWGGGSAAGIDCSGLTQLANAMVGKNIPRDSDQQEAALQKLDKKDRSRNDLVFWPGHVGIIGEDDCLIHATAWKMKVIKEPLADAIARIGEPSNFRRVS